MRSRALIVGAALVVGLIAAYAAWAYLESARTTVQAQAKPVEVLVAVQDIPRGTPIEEIISRKMAERQLIPSRFVAAGAISSAAKVEGQVLANALTKREQLTTARFQFPTDAGLAYSVPAEYVALSVPVDESHGLAGLVKPGDQVVVIATLNPTQDAAVTVVLVPKARVLAVNRSVGIERQQNTAQAQSSPNLTGGAAESSTPKTVTVALALTDAAKCVLASEKGKIWFALLPAAATTSAPTATGPMTPAALTGR